MRGHGGECRADPAQGQSWAGTSLNFGRSSAIGCVRPMVRSNQAHRTMGQGHSKQGAMMKERMSFAIRVYLVTLIWLAAMVSVVVALIGPLGSAYGSVDLGVYTRTALTMALAMSTATGLAVVVWRRLQPHGQSVDVTSGEDRHTVAAPVGAQRA